MTAARSPVSLGDALRALGHLRPSDPAMVAEILDVLGMSPRARPLARPRTAATVARRPARDEPAAAPAPAPPRFAALQDADAPSPLDEPVASSLEVQVPPESRGIDGVVELPKGDATALAPIEPLLWPPWVRGILSAALSVALLDGPVDVDRAVHTVARVEPIAAVPRLPAPTLRLGVQLVIDRSARMVPFMKDQAWLRWALRAVVGEAHVEVHSFTGSPAQLGALRPYAPPPAGTPVLLLSDLGIGAPMLDPHPSAVVDWLAFNRRLRLAGCPLTALVPYRPERWPSRLGRELTIVQWDRDTSVATIRGRAGSKNAS